MRKKLIACMLIVTMVICNSMVAWADTWNGGDDYSSGSHEVTTTFTKAPSVYSVTLEWGSLVYSYTGSVSWNGSKYTATAGNWSTQDEYAIRITNNSEASIYTNLSLDTTARMFNDVTTTFSNNIDVGVIEVGSLATGNGTNILESDLTLAGTPSFKENVTNNIVSAPMHIGYITVKIGEDNSFSGGYNN